MSEKLYSLKKITFSPDSFYAYPVLECDGECERFCLVYTSYGEFIKDKKYFTEEDLNDIREEDAFSRGVLFGVRSLACAPSSEKNMIIKLRKKGIDADISARVAKYFVENGYIDEKAQAKNEVCCCLKKKYGQIKIKARLIEKGFKTNIISKWMIKLEDYDFASACLSLARERGIQNPYDREERDAMYSFLSRNGYMHECIKSVLSKLYNI